MGNAASKRSIDEIIGSIRTIVADGRAANDPTAPFGAPANDDDYLPVDLSDLPTNARRSPRIDRDLLEEFAEPVSRRYTEEDYSATAVETDDPDDLDLNGLAVENKGDAPPRADASNVSDADQMAEIAATVERNLEYMSVPKPRSVRASEASFAKFEALRAAVDRPTPKAERLPEPAPPAVIDQQQVVVPSNPPAVVANGQDETANDFELDEAMLRPIIREWLDDNLPPIVERLVREELRSAIDGKPAKAR